MRIAKLVATNKRILSLQDILNAEDSALEKDREETEALYEQAIKSSVRGGFLADAGLANERFADYLLCAGDEIEAKYRVEQSMKYYSAWGAMKKVDLMKSKWARVLSIVEKSY